MVQENHLIEYKRELSDTFERSVVSFLNSNTGGHIFIGVNDDGTIHGVSDTDYLQRQISDRILNNIKPNSIGLFEIVNEEHLDKEGVSQNVIHVIVSGGTEKPYYLKKYGMTPNGCFIRVGSSTHEMTENMILETFSRRAKLSLAKLPAPRQDLSFSQLKIYYEECGKTLNNQFAKTLELLLPDGRFNYNAYLLADENGVSIKVARYSGTDKYDLIENEEFGYCSLIKAVKSVLTRLQVANITRTKITPAERIEQPLVDPVALREAVINAVVHNDYTREVPPLFEIFSNRIEITTYGGLVEGLSKEDFFACCSMPRNREIMRIFRDLDMVEQLGSGMKRILRTYDETSFSFTDHFMRTSFYFDKQDDRINDRINDENDRINDRINDENDRINGRINAENGRINGRINAENGRINDSINLSDTELLVFAEIKRDPKMTVPLLINDTGLSERTINRTLKALRENGYIVRVGARKNGYWKILK